MHSAIRFLPNRFLTPASYIAGCALLIGLIFFLSHWGHAEKGHGFLLSVYICLCLLLGYSLQTLKPLITTFCVIAILVTIGFSSLKFHWREGILIQSHRDEAPAIDRYVSDYPTYEDTLFAPLTGAPQWYDFSEECLEPALSYLPMAENCHSQNRIADRYNINIITVIQNYYSLMRQTAQAIADDKIKTVEDYRSCLNLKHCAFLPLLPARTLTGGISSATDNHYQTVRNQFESILKHSSVQPETCDFMDLCRIMRDANIITIRATVD